MNILGVTSHKHWYLVGIMISTVVVLLSATAVQVVLAADITLFAPTSKPYGLTFGEWAAKWHTWLYSIPGPINPATDTTGKNCAQGQAGPAWFLAGTTGGSAVRTCTVPADCERVFI